MRSYCVLVSILAVVLTFASASPLSAQLVIPGADGSDGAFAPVANVTIDLSLAATMDSGAGQSWSTASPVAGNGVYDPDQWLIVFKYSSVNIPAGVTVTFTNHPSRAPVAWLVSGSVTIDGTVDLNGSAGVNGVDNAEPGPGGFRGGRQSYGSSGGSPSQGGFGPSGGFPSGGDGSYGGTFGYGNPQIVPLIGGSGGAGSGSGPGGAGGGAILIAAPNQIAITGLIQASGGVGPGAGGEGAGGAIRLVCDTLNMTGQLVVALNNGDDGRLRVEANSVIGSLATSDPRPIPVLPDTPVVIVPKSTAPTVRVVSAHGTNVPSDPPAQLPPNADVKINATGDITFVIETTNVEVNSTVELRILNHEGSGTGFGAVFNLNALHAGGNFTLSTWTVTFTPGSLADYTVQARVIRPTP